MTAALAGGTARADAPAGSSATARRLLNDALEQAKQGHLDQAFLLAKEATEAGDDTPATVTAREYLRQRATLNHLQRAHSLELAGRSAEAAIEYRTAMAIDPSNLEARQGLA
ncbi:MAG: hypothetical protein ACREEA_11955, partial [Stellaceae bacterium]